MSSSKGLRQVSFQLDYYMSSQFAGVAMAMRKGLYSKAGIDLRLLPNCPPGDEAKVVSDGFQQDKGKSLWAGCMEQNTLLPAIGTGCSVKAVAAMFGRSPLCLAGMPGSDLRARAAKKDRLRIAAHVDTVDLLQRILPYAEVIGMPREDKMALLKSGQVDAVQAYDVMETLKIAHDTNGSAEILPLEGAAFLDVSLGYGQVIFAPSQALLDEAHRAALKDFVRATFQGWNQAIRDPQGASRILLDMQEDVDHWVKEQSFVEASVRLCSDYVKRTKRCGELGMIDKERWAKATTWLSTSAPGESLDASVWCVDDRHVDAHPVAEAVRKEAAQHAADALAIHGTPPKLVVLTVGSDALGSTHKDGLRRLEVMGIADQSWFSKTAAGAVLGIEVREINLPASATTDQLLQEIEKHRDADGIQLMWPLPPTVDPIAALEAIPASQDVDGHMAGLYQLDGGEAAGAESTLGALSEGPSPATCDGILRILAFHRVKISGAKVCIIGRSWLFGQPLARLLRWHGASVEVAHTGNSPEEIKAMCLRATVVIPAAGRPGFVRGDWIAPGASVVNVGTTFTDDDILPDIADLDEFPHAGLVVRTIGPIAVAMLMRSVALKALACPRFPPFCAAP
mmetsp:Transcript_81353/g.213577  ORF Transcript_81353/g.213577 Transcript_81353/m.213577 type:complete len:624 (-) Transcript_81353:30-1901(-)